MNELLTRSEAYRRSGLHRRTIERRIQAGQIETVPVHGYKVPRVSKNSLDDFMAFIWPTQKKTKPFRRPGVTNADPTAQAWLYEIIDPKDGQAIYIGFTAQKSYKSRWQQHRGDLKANRHYNRQLQNLWNKRDKPLIFKIIADGMSGLMMEREKRAIAELRKKIGDRCCNGTDGGEGSGGMSQATKDKISEISRKKWQDPEYRKRYEQATGNKLHGKTSKQGKLLTKWKWLCEQVQYACDRILKENQRKLSKDDFVWPTCLDHCYIPLKQGQWVKTTTDIAHWARSHTLMWRMDSKRRQSPRPVASAKEGGKLMMPQPWQILGYEPVGPISGTCIRCGDKFIGKRTKKHCSKRCSRAMRDRRKRASKSSRMS